MPRYIEHTNDFGDHFVVRHMTDTEWFDDLREQQRYAFGMCPFLYGVFRANLDTKQKMCRHKYQTCEDGYVCIRCGSYK